jgi:hypothetical protein
MRLTSLSAAEVLDRTHIDHHCMKNASDGFKFIFIAVDIASGNFQLSPTRTQSAEETARVFFRDHLSIFGFPRVVISDRGSGFMSQLFTSLAREGERCSIRRSSAHHPQTNSCCELINRRIVTYLRAYCSDSKDWSNLLPAISFANRQMVNLTTGVTPFFALYGREMGSFADFDQLNHPERFGEKHAITHFYTELSTMRDILKKNVQTSRDKTDQRHNENVSNPNFQVGDLVLYETRKHPTFG